MKYRLVEKEDYVNISDYYLRNESHFKLWQPKTAHDFHSVGNWKERIEHYLSSQSEGAGYYFVATENGNIYGHCSLSQVTRGVFQAAYMGYGVCHTYEGKGVAFELALNAIKFAFSEAKLHRIMANYMPHNNRSAKLLIRLGFKREGFARNYLKINGRWENHVLTSLYNQSYT
jgi:ribosomal-protein-alanine N-acetyltransferase